MKKKRALILGLGVSGKGAVKLLLKNGFSVLGADRNAASLTNLCGEHPENLEIALDAPDLSLEGICLAVISPGIDPAHPLISKVRDAGIEMVCEIELAFRYLPNQRVFGITGSNGKTTTVLLTTHVLNQSGIRAIAAGNVGTALSAYAIEAKPEETLIIELSSFQLEMLELTGRFDAAMILNITPNHLNRHASFSEYAKAKLRIGSCLKPNGKLFASKAVVEAFGADLAHPEIFDAIPIAMEYTVHSGMAETPNVQAALALSRACGVSDLQFFESIKSFRKPSHRIERVAEIDSVAYYNDSKASNIDAVMHAVKLFPGPIILIAGGVDKGASYKPWIQSFFGKVKKLIVFGEAAHKMELELSNDFNLKRVGTLMEAVEDANRCAASGDTVLFSPGCSSYDQFANYEERGNTFKKIVLGS